MSRNVALATIAGESTYTYALWNSADKSADLRVVGSGRLLQAAVSGSKADKGMCRSQVGLSAGKWYVECLFHSVSIATQVLRFGLAPAGASLTAGVGTHATSYGLDEDGKVYNNGVGTILVSSFHSAGAVLVGMAVDLDAGKIWFSVDGVWSGDPEAGTGAAVSGLSGTYYLAGSADDIAEPFNGLTLVSSPGTLYRTPRGFNSGWYTFTDAEEHIGTESFVSHADDAVRPNRLWEGRIRKASLTYERGVDCWIWGGSGIRRTRGQIDIRNGDQGVTSWLSQVWRDRVVRLDLANSDGRYDEAVAFGESVIDRLEAIDRRSLRFVMRDRLAQVEKALQTNLYPVSTPVVELRESPKPLTIGRCDFVPMLATDTALSLHQVHDAVPTTVHAVYDKGGLLTGLGYSVEVDGQIKRLTSIAGRQVATISGQKRADGTAMERLPEILVEILQTRAGLPAQQLDLATAIAIDTARPLKLGIHLRDQSLASDVVRRVMDTFCGCLWEDSWGVLRAWRLAAPAATAAYSLSDVEIMTDIKRDFDQARGLTKAIAGRFNYGIHGDADLIGSVVGTALGEQLKSEWLGRKSYTGSSLHASYSHAEGAPPWPTLCSDETQLQALINEVISLYTVERYFYSFSANIGVARSLAIAPGDTIEVSSAQQGLSAGKKMVVVWARSEPGRGRVDLKCWG